MRNPGLASQTGFIYDLDDNRKSHVRSSVAQNSNPGDPETQVQVIPSAYKQEGSVLGIGNPLVRSLPYYVTCPEMTFVVNCRRPNETGLS